MLTLTLCLAATTKHNSCEWWFCSSNQHGDPHSPFPCILPHQLASSQQTLPKYAGPPDLRPHLLQGAGLPAVSG